MAGWPGRDPSRVITIRHSAWLAWRSPPRLSRCRLTLPDEAGIGAAPHRCAHELSLRSRSGWSPAAISSSAAVSEPTPCRREQARRAGGDQRADQVIQALQLGVQELGAAAQLAQRDPGARSRGTSPGRGRSAAIASTSCAGVVPGEPGPQLIRAGHDQRPGLVDRLGPLGAGAALGHHQRPDRLHRAVAALRRARCPPGLRGPGGADRVAG